MTDPGDTTKAGGGPDGLALLIQAMAALMAAEGPGSGGWTRFADAFAAEAAARAAAPGASPFDPGGWLRAPGQGGMADLWRWMEGPGFADLFAEERAAIRASGEWLALAAAWAQYARVMGDGWQAALRRFAQALATPAAAPRAPHGADAPPRAADAARQGADARAAHGANTSPDGATPQPQAADLLALWREIADAELAATQTSPAFLAAQRDLIAADLAARALLRSRIERVTAHLGLPTRAELDDVHRQLHALRRDLRTLRPAPGAPPPARDGRDPAPRDGGGPDGEAPAAGGGSGPSADAPPDRGAR